MIKVLDNVYDLVTLNMEQRFSERVALRFYDKETDEVTVVHYKDYARDIRRAVNYFQSTIPDIKGKKICLLNKNSYEYAVNTFGIILAGGVLVLLNQHKSWDELSYELGLVDPAAILTDGDDYGTKEQLQAAYGSILRPMDGFRAYEPVAEMPRCIGHDDLMILMFTSGTTGRSKGVMLSERNFFSVMRAHVQIGERMMEYKHDPELVVSQYTVLPMFHLGAFICLFSWAHGGWALNISGDIRNFYKEIRRMPSQVMAVVPVIMNSLHKDVMRGLHNIENLLAAAAAVWGLVPVEAIQQVGSTFTGVEHRIEPVRTLDGVLYYNDSIGTSPTRTIAGLRSFNQKVILIAGGYDKHIPYEPLAPEVIAHVKNLVLMGATGPRIEKAVRECEGFDEAALPIQHADNMQHAVELARAAAKPGDIIILSPASASFDLYPNFEVRGREFKKIVNALK